MGLRGNQQVGRHIAEHDRVVLGRGLGLVVPLRQQLVDLVGGDLPGAGIDREQLAPDRLALARTAIDQSRPGAATATADRRTEPPDADVRQFADVGGEAQVDDGRFVAEGRRARRFALRASRAGGLP